MRSSEFASETMSELMASLNYRQFLGALQHLERATQPQVEWNPDQLKMATAAIDKMRSEITECVELLLKAHGPHKTITEMVDYAIMLGRMQQPED